MREYRSSTTDEQQQAEEVVVPVVARRRKSKLVVPPPPSPPPPPPAWLQGLMGETFFAACGVHINIRKNEKNIFCLDCCHSFCTNCLPSHHSHHLLQVRRYVYQNVIRLEDLEKLIDCCFIQPYTINGAKVVFVNQRAQSKGGKSSSGNACLTCDRILQEPFNYCSLSCKVDYMVNEGEDLSNILHEFEESTISQFESLHMDAAYQEHLDDGQITPSSILEDPSEYIGSSSSTSYSCNVEGNPEISHQEEVIVKKKKNDSGILPGAMSSLSNRRKGAPHRSPLS